MFDKGEMEFKQVASGVDELLSRLDQGLFNSVASTAALERAFEQIADILKPLAPIKGSCDEVKELWIRVPRGESRDDGCDYLDEFVWYRLMLCKGFNKDGSLFYYCLMLNNETVLNATIGGRVDLLPEEFDETASIKICELIIPAVEESMKLLKEGKYNEFVEAQLPYQHRTGVIRRSDIWATDPGKKEETYGSLTETDIKKFKDHIAYNDNRADKIGKIINFNANMFFKACKLGYEAVGEDCEGYSLPELYVRFSDGRDEGLTGLSPSANKGAGIDFYEPQAWDEWYFWRNYIDIGHPWEVYPGVVLRVCSNRFDTEMDFKRGDITEEEYRDRLTYLGYYFDVWAGNRPFESVKFYNAISEAGYPVIMSGGRELVKSFEGSDYVGIVPHWRSERYCAEIMPEEYGEIIGFEYVDKERDEWFDKIMWLPEKPAKLL